MHADKVSAVRITNCRGFSAKGGVNRSFTSGDGVKNISFIRGGSIVI